MCVCLMRVFSFVLVWCEGGGGRDKRDCRRECVGGLMMGAGITYITKKKGVGEFSVYVK